MAPAPPVVPIPVPGAPPATSFTTPGLEFGLNVVGYNAAAFTPALQTTLCNAITAASGITGACAFFFLLWQSCFLFDAPTIC